MSKSKIIGYINLTIPAGKASPAPPIGPALGQKGLNIMDFCKKFNDQTKSMESETPVPVVITAYADKSFTFITKTPPASYFLKKYAKTKKGSSATKKDSAVGKVSLSDVEEIAKIKLQDLNAYNIDAAVRIIIGTAASMGIEVTN
ncbi:MAG: 50S ribosomal protein L11 [Rickettsiaceae bacterium]